MTDKEKIREEITKKLEVMQYQVHRKDAYKELKGVLAYIDSLQEEPASEPQVKESAKIQHVNDMCKENGKFLTHEPVSEDLEKASREWLAPQLDKSYANYGEGKMMELTHFDGYAMLDAIEFGAKWGKNQAKAEIQAQSMALAHGCPKEPVSEDLRDAARKYFKSLKDYCFISSDIMLAFKAGANWQKEHIWKPADGNDLPIIDREVIALLDNGKVVFAHRPPEYWDGKNIITGKVTRNYPKTYGKGCWNITDIKWWLDCSTPKEIEL